MTSHRPPFALEAATRTGLSEAQAAAKELVLRLSTNPEDPLANLRAAEVLGQEILQHRIAPELVKEARGRGASWADVGLNCLKSRQRGDADTLSGQSAFARYGGPAVEDTPQSRAARMTEMRQRVEALKTQGLEVLPGLTRAEAAARLGVEAKTVQRRAARRDGVRMEEVQARSGRLHKRYFLLEQAGADKD